MSGPRSFGLRLLAWLGLAFVVVGSGCGSTGTGSPGPSSPPQFADVDDGKLQRLVRQVLEANSRRYLDVKQHGAWQILHGILAYQDRFLVTHEGRLVSALKWILDGNPVEGFLLEPTEQGLEVISQPGSQIGQGHEDQWLAVLSQCGLSLKQPIRWQGRTYTLGDMLRRAQWDVDEQMEMSWTLIALSRYLPKDAQWTNYQGQTWTVEKVVEVEVAQDLHSSPCGGTHRLIGLVMALQAYHEPGESLRGAWAQAQQRILEAISLARAYQNPDGSFSTEYFERPASSPDVEKRLGTTGHTVEFLALALPPEQLAAPWMENAVQHLCWLLQETEDMALECGALYHALHGLQVYYQRRFGSPGEVIADSAPSGEKFAQVPSFKDSEPENPPPFPQSGPNSSQQP